MRLLLDTHVLLWALADPDELSSSARAAIEDGSTFVGISAASVWEIAIKRARGRLSAPEDLPRALHRLGFEPLAITVEHAIAAGALPRHHADPFDRMLVAQALIEGFTIVTRNPDFAPYGVPLLSA